MTGSVQGAAEIRYRFFVDFFDWARTFAQERWYFLVLGILVLVLLWRSARH